MMGLFRLLPFSWKIFTILSFITAISASAYVIHRSIYNSGYAECESHITKKMREQNDEARKNIIALEDEYKKRLDDVNKVGNDNPVGAGVSRAIDSLP